MLSHLPRQDEEPVYGEELSDADGDENGDHDPAVRLKELLSRGASSATETLVIHSDDDGVIDDDPDAVVEVGFWCQCPSCKGDSGGVTFPTAVAPPAAKPAFLQMATLEIPNPIRGAQKTDTLLPTKRRLGTKTTPTMDTANQSSITPIRVH